jgi:cytochrome P450
MADDPLDPFSPAATVDPHPVYRRLRDEAPVRYVPSMDVWTVARHADVVEVLRDARTFSSELGMGELMSGRLVPGQSSLPEMPGAMESMRLVIAADPPDHTKLRRLVSAPFAGREMAALEPRVRALTESLVDDLVAADEPDLVEHVGWPLPVIVIAEVLGIPPSRRDDFKRWSTDMVGGLSGDLDLMGKQQSAIEMFEFFATAIAERQLQPGTDAISTLVSKANVLEGEERLEVPELVAFCILLLIAGNETTTNLVANAFRAFFDSPGEWERLVADPSLAAAAVEEALRFDGPVKAIMRMPAEPAAIAGVAIPAKARVMPLFSSANRDERCWPDADVLRVDRNPQEHVAFGYGIHHCLGAPLARLEARVLFETLARRGIRLSPRGEGEPVRSPILRGWSALPVSVSTTG